MESRLILIAVAISACSAEPSLEDVDPALFAATPTYSREIRPLFTQYCVACHAHDGERIGGVELDTYESAYARRIHNTCVSVTQPVIDRFAACLVPLRLRPDPADTSVPCPDPPPGPPCRDEGPGGELRPWPPYSMPEGARSGMTLEEQVILARWIELGAPE